MFHLLDSMASISMFCPFHSLTFILVRSFIEVWLLISTLAFSEDEGIIFDLLQREDLANFI